MKTAIRAVVLALGTGALVAAWFGYQGPLLGIFLALDFCQ